MIIYPDSSFLVSFLYAADVNHSAASNWLKPRINEEWIISPWSEFETMNVLRSLCLRSRGPSPELIEGLRRYFKHLFTHGPMERAAVDWVEVINDANQISAALANRMLTRAADTLHVAILEQVNPDLFITFDKNQAALAIRRGFKTTLLKPAAT